IERRVCWQLKEKESLRPILQLSVLEEEGKEIAADEVPLDVQLAGQRMKTLLERALANVPEESRRVFELRDVQEFSGEEVARRLGISLSAMKSRLHRARSQIRKQLDDALAA